MIIIEKRGTLPYKIFDVDDSELTHHSDHVSYTLYNIDGKSQNYTASRSCCIEDKSSVQTIITVSGEIIKKFVKEIFNLTVDLDDDNLDNSNITNLFDLFDDNSYDYLNSKYCETINHFIDEITSFTNRDSQFVKSTVNAVYKKIIESESKRLIKEYITDYYNYTLDDLNDITDNDIISIIDDDVPELSTFLFVIKEIQGNAF